MGKVVLVPFNGEEMCFIHVLLNALDMDAKGMQARIVVEGSATGLVPRLRQEDNPLHALYGRCKDKGFFAGVCKACATKTGGLEAAKEEGLPLLDEMNGHPSMGGWIEDGWTVITF
jgi:hypothetical protein